jgi:hypothetical protein
MKQYCCLQNLSLGPGVHLHAVSLGVNAAWYEGCIEITMYSPYMPMVSLFTQVYEFCIVTLHVGKQL